MLERSRILLIASLISLLSACGSRESSIATIAQDLQPAALPVAGQGWPSALPQDAAQPWELQADSHAGSSINAASDFTPGVERFLEGAGSGASVSNQGEATRLDSGAAGSGKTAWAIYRLPLGAAQPGALSLDVNFNAQSNGTESSFYLAVSDYAQQRWVWQGPFTRNNNVRLAGGLLPESNYNSGAGHMFVCLLAYDGSSVDVVGVSVNADDSADTAAPPQPGGLTLSPVSGGVEAQWNSVLAGDLAGYQVYYSRFPFSDVHAAGVRRLPYLEGLTRCFIPADGEGPGLHVAVSAVDVNGNESTAFSVPEVLIASGISGALALSVAKSSVQRGDPLSLSLSGSASYDLDLDGDGVYEVTDSTSTTVSLDTSAPGLLRANVRSEDGTAVAHGGVSVIVFANTRPVCTAVASPSSGDAPLLVDFSGEAEDSEDAAAALSYAWDFDGDGIYETGTDTLNPAQQNYADPGFYNVRLRVTDTQGAWGSSTVGVLVTGTGPNELPDGFMGTDVAGGVVPITVHFNSDNVTDADGTIVQYDWDFNGDGIWEVYDGPAELDWTYTEAGSPDIFLRVTDNDGGRSVIFDNLSFTAPGNNPPVANLTPVTQTGTVPLAINFNASGSTAGGDAGDSIVKYEWDFDGNGNWDGYGEDPTITQVYTSPGVFTARLRVTDEMGNQHIDTSTITANVQGNNPPVANLLPASASGTAPLTVNFDASGSTAGGDTGDSIVKYEWDWDGNGTFDGYGEDATISFTYNSAGSFTAILRVTDEAGNQAVDTSAVSASALPVILDDHDSGNAGRHTSMKFINGVPMIAYYDDLDTELRFVHGTDGFGSGWTAPLILDSAGLTGSYPSLAEVQERPAVVFYYDTTAELRYMRSENAYGNSPWYPIESLNSGGSYQDTSLAVINGKPAVAYYDFGNQIVYFQSSDDATGETWNPAVVISSNIADGGACSLASVNGNPAISFYDGNSQKLCFQRSLDAGGAAWPALMNPDPVALRGKNTSMLVVNSKPAICYYDESSDNLLFVRALDADGAVWGTPVNPGTPGDDAENPSMQVVGLKPLICCTLGSGALRCYKAADLDGANWAAPITLDTGTAAFGCSLADVQGLPAISYGSVSQGDLRYLRGF